MLRGLRFQKKSSNYFLSIIYFSLFLLSVSLVTAQDDFTAVTSPSVINACACNTQSSKISILNTGEIEINYLVSAAAKNQDLITFANPQFLLKPAQSKDVFTFIKVPCDTAASFDITTLIQTGFGTTKEIKQTIQPITCESVLLFVDKQDQVTNACTPVVYKLTLRNSMNYLQVFELSLDLKPEYYRLTHNPVVLAPYETKEVFLYVTLPCEFAEKASFTLTAKDQATKTLQTAVLSVSINKGSYGYALDVGMPITPSNDAETVSFNYVPAKEASYTVCENTNTIIPVKLGNTGYLYNGYNVNINPQQSWLAYDSSYFWLLPSQQYITPLYVQPYTRDSGNYSLNLVSTSSKGDLSYKIPLEISVVKCVPDESEAAKTKKKMIIGLMVLLLLLILIILLLLVIYIKRKRLQKLHPIAEEYYAKQREEEERKLKKIEEKKVSDKKAAAKKQKEVEDNKRMSGWKVWGIIILMLLIVSVLGFALLMKNVYMPTLTKMNKNIQEKIKTPFTEQKNVSAAAKGVSTVSFNASKDIFTKKESEKKPVELYDPQKKYKLNETQLKILYHEMYEDKPYNFFLDGYFVDADEDYLVITHSPVKNLSIAMDGTYVKVTPDKDFTGERRVIFTADDSKGGIAYSPEFIFVVKPIPEFVTKSSKNIAGIIVSVIVVIILLTLILLLWIKPPRQPIVKQKEKKDIEFDF